MSYINFLRASTNNKSSIFFELNPLLERVWVSITYDTVLFLFYTSGTHTYNEFINSGNKTPFAYGQGRLLNWLASSAIFYDLLTSFNAYTHIDGSIIDFIFVKIWDKVWSLHAKRSLALIFFPSVLNATMTNILKNYFVNSTNWWYSCCKIKKKHIIDNREYNQRLLQGFNSILMESSWRIIRNYSNDNRIR